MRTYGPLAGESIEETADAMFILSGAFPTEEITADFNGVTIVVNRSYTPEMIVEFFLKEVQRRHDEYIASDEYKKMKRKQEEDERNKKLAFENALMASPEMITLRDSQAWNAAVEKNVDPYGSAVIRFAEHWARIMEGRVAAGDTIDKCAKETAHVVDIEGITGFMYGAAVSTLSQVWIYGEELRRWHNLATQINDEGEKANESGGVLNPALLGLSSS